jgi:pimeloyl-ACP methyl ester carboxylesterase
MKRWAALGLCLLPVWACDETVSEGPPPGTGGAAGMGGAGGAEACAVELVYAPTAGAIDAFPDDFFTEGDGDGLRVHIVDGENFDLPAEAQQFGLVFEQLSTLDGFGTNAALYLQFTGPIDPGTLPKPADSARDDSSILLIADPGGAATLVPFETELVAEAEGAEHTTLVITPLVPLAPRTRHALFVSADVRAAGGACIATSAEMGSLLDGSADDPGLLRLADRYGELADALGGLGRSSSEAIAELVFTTQHTVDDSASIAQTIRTTATSGYTAVDTCTDPGGDFLVCEGELLADDFRVDAHHIDEADLNPQASYTLKVTTYLPKTGTAPYPTILFGHGLGGDRHQAEALAEFAAPNGYASVAIDAVKHGEHPDQPSSTLPIGDVLGFFGLGLGANPIDAFQLRDNWRQSTYDKLQVIEMLRGGVDVDGDAQIDVDADNLMYIGVSLGGIMAAELLALSQDIDVAIPIVPGARVVNIIKDGSQFAIVIGLLSGMATQGQIARFFPLVQTVIERGDAGSYTEHVVSRRLPGFEAQTPQVLMQMVLDDDTVPNSTNLYYARGLGAPHVGDELLPIGVIPHEATLPVSGNVDATHTAGVFQFDIVLQGDGPDTEPATHSNIGRNAVSQEQSIHFIQTFYADGVAEILDPYVTLGIKP